MKPAAIFDMDGTLCDVSSIRYHINPEHPKFSGHKRFDRFHADAINCPPHPKAIRLYHQANDDGLSILVVTARMGVWAIHTLLWLKENHIEHDELYMRRNLDYRKDVVVKNEILCRILRDGYRPQFAVDDNPAIIDLWKDHGIKTYVIPGWERT